MKTKLMMMLACTFMALQSVNAQDFRWGLMAGVNTNAPKKSGTKAGFDFGVKGELGLPATAKGLYLGFGAMLSLEQEDYAGFYSNSSVKSSPYFLNIPVHIGYRFALGNNVNAFVNAGPYVGIGLFGKQKTKVNALDGATSETTTADNVFSDDMCKRFDWGLGASVGVELARHYQLSVGYDWGLKDLKTDKMPIENKHRVFRATFAYMF